MEKNKKLLVFPIDLDTAQNFAFKATELGISVLVASSDLKTSNLDNLPERLFLPYITDTNFKLSLIQLIKKHSISHIYTSHFGVWLHLDTLIQEQTIDCILCQPNPFESNWNEFKNSHNWAMNIVNDQLIKNIPSTSELKAKLTLHQLAGLHQQFSRIPGQCDEQKLRSLVAVMRVVPTGDIVEIGSLYGRSACTLAWLAGKYASGNVISVDPWSSNKTEDQGNKAKIMNNELKNIDHDKIFQIFLSNASVQNNLSYIKEISENAIVIYRNAIKRGYLESTHIENISIKGSISLLHIDGNHRYDFVKKDISLWEPLVCSGGWILIDDYVWAFGNGPKLAGDELLEVCNLDTAFCLGDTLYLRKK